MDATPKFRTFALLCCLRRVLPSIEIMGFKSTVARGKVFIGCLPIILLLGLPCLVSAQAPLRHYTTTFDNCVGLVGSDVLVIDTQAWKFTEIATGIDYVFPNVNLTAGDAIDVFGLNTDCPRLSEGKINNTAPLHLTINFVNYYVEPTSSLYAPKYIMTGKAAPTAEVR